MSNSVVNDFEQEELRIKQLMRQNIRRAYKGEVPVSEDESPERTQSHWNGCVKGAQLRDSKGQHTKDIY